MNSRYKPVGWRNESHRHYLAAKGIKTRYDASKYDLIHRRTTMPVVFEPANTVHFKPEFHQQKLDTLKFNELKGASKEEITAATNEMGDRYMEMGMSPQEAASMVHAAIQNSEAYDEKASQYFAMKDWFKSDGEVKDDGGVFGTRFKNDSYLTNARHSDSERKNRVYEDRIQTGIDKGEIKHECLDEYRDLFKGLQRQFVNKEITRQQFEQELQGKGDWLIQRNKKNLDVWGPLHGEVKVPEQSSNPLLGPSEQSLSNPLLGGSK